MNKHTDSLPDNRITVDQILRALKRVEKNGNGWKASCPLTGNHKHHDRKPSLSISVENGKPLVYCHAGCDQAAVWKAICERVGEPDRSYPEDATGVITIPEAPKRKFTGTPADVEKFNSALRSPAGLEYLAKRGISVEVAQRLDWGIAPKFKGQERPALMIPHYRDGELVGIKARTIDGDKEFYQFPGSTIDGLYASNHLEDGLLSDEVSVFEGCEDTALALTHGFNATGLISAGSKVSQQDLDTLNQYSRIYLIGDQDSAGQKAMDALQDKLPAEKVIRVRLPGVKDIGEIYCQTPDKFRERIEELRAEALARPPAWRGLFKARDEMEQGDMKFLVKDFLPEGVAMIGALSGSGKTWLCLSLAKALTTGRKFLGRFEVAEPTNVIYLIPESGERAFRSRMDRMGIDKRFLCRTMKDGILKLNDPLLKEAIKALKPVVFLDTSVRFATGEENNASDNAKGLAEAIFELLKAGARAVVGLHHSAKSAADKFPTLENTLRGSGDIGAMCDCVYNLKCENQEVLELRVTCVKARDFEPVPPFNIQGRPYINENGDFGMLLSPGLPKEQAESLSLMEAIKANPRATYRELEEKTGINVARISKRAAQMGWKKPGDTWLADPNTLV